MRVLVANAGSAGPDPGWLTTDEWADALAVPRSRMSKELNKVFRQGLLLTKRTFRATRDGSSRPVPVYSLKK